jgi:hypothetical protein
MLKREKEVASSAARSRVTRHCYCSVITWLDLGDGSKYSGCSSSSLLLVLDVVYRSVIKINPKW